MTSESEVDHCRILMYDGPFFTVFISVFCFFHARGELAPAVINSTCYCAAVCAFWLLKRLSTSYRNQRSLFSAPEPLDWRSSGIGELLANTLAVRNVTVVVLDIKPIQTENYNVTYYKCDVSKWEEVEAVSKRVIEEVGHPTILVNNAGVVQGKRILDLDPQDLYQTFGVNTFAHFWTLKTFLPKMIERNSGHIVTLASALGFVGFARVSDYCASKAAVLTMHESLRHELASYHSPGIRTTLVCPGWVRTPLMSTATFSNNVFIRFFVPILAPVTVVKAIIAALDTQESRSIHLPLYSALFMKLLPSVIDDFVRKLSCVDFIMKDFTKVTGIREDEVSASQSKKVV
ncbi:retinal short-chain dehydrogenase reductase [Imleria badia]|nr:retinal short-chain dehydrogenase reductase [Imleria badia]